MPGFVVNGTGGHAGLNGPNSLIETKRTHRWVWQTLGRASRDILLYLKTSQRPNFEFEEPSMHHNQEQVYFAGKHTWSPITMVWYDVEQDPDVSGEVYKWLGTVIDIPNMCVFRPGNGSFGRGPGYKSAYSTLRMLDGCGNAHEEWAIYNSWPSKTNFGSLDYTSSDIQTLEVSLRYDRAQRLQ